MAKKLTDLYRAGLCCGFGAGPARVIYHAYHDSCYGKTFVLCLKHAYPDSGSCSDYAVPSTMRSLPERLADVMRQLFSRHASSVVITCAKYAYSLQSQPSIAVKLAK